MKRMIFAALMMAFFTTGCADKSNDKVNETKAAASKVIESAADGEVTAKSTAVSTTATEKKTETAPAAFGPQKFIEGQQFQRLAQDVPKANPDKPEVVEVFWYGCIHCFHFEPVISGWAKSSKPANVEFVQIPAVWNERLNLHAKMFYATKQMGLMDKMHEKLFNAMNVDHKKFENAEEIADFFAANGQDKATFLNVFNSFGVTSQAAAAGAKVQKYGIEGTPEVIVNGRYRTSARMAGSQEKMLDVIDYLLALKD